MCLDRRSYNPTACSLKLSENDSRTCIQASWLADHLEVCLWEGAKERSERLTFRDTFFLNLPHFSCETNTATIILLGNKNAVRYLSVNY